MTQAQPSNHSERRQPAQIKVPTYPFTAIIGQEEMKLALILNVIDPRVGGVMIMGDRGTGKSTTVRALAELLPEVPSVADCPFGCHPEKTSEMCPSCRERTAAGEALPMTYRKTRVVDLPLGATEDRVCGTIDIQKALAEGVKAFEPGLLAQANRGFLYVDEVNLLDDHLVDVLLDSAASGVNVVEREGISIRHPARFVLVGSGNPEEGELRPQLLDRFGLHAQIRTLRDAQKRVAIIRSRSDFDNEPETFIEKFEAPQADLQAKITRAKEILGDVTVGDDVLLKIAQLCIELEIDGHRGELVLARTAKALAAFEGRTEVCDDDVARIAVLGLRHRLRKDPLATMDNGRRVQEKVAQIFGVEKAGA
ncbi:magnesium chelatase ATPase subunit I [Heliobacterium gestii]|uniref:Mg-protoporphyrin IX chelatase n=1 Tax=Heliomicrobium gestii TaxID=2699 RepID=A0A845LDT4_HELGE|nr:magnesium chelatase ATPase subunit I [Heliomicrobium gestii]MBM7866427.1 magnesium chelatase subunit I [Heliomicrobium gestii]MZP42789.1 magnesium chelatase ATPase subunit I [Heliomicrobium gestii]